MEYFGQKNNNMHNLSIIANFGLDIHFQTHVPCELYVDIIPSTPKNAIRVLWTIEPNEVSGFRQAAINNCDKFDLILTWDENILNSCPNAKLFPYGTTWIKDFVFTEKEFCITTLIGGKTQCAGHVLRHSIPQALTSIDNIPYHIYNSINSSFSHGTNFRTMKSNVWKNELFYSQFHIVVENVFSNNWFTEKLIDCFQTKTIPIYIGCENIGDFFDKRGFFHVKNLDELVDVCKGINPSTYNTMLDYVEHNYLESMKYNDHRARIENTIKDFVSKTL